MHIDQMTPPALAIAATALHRHRVALDALRIRTERELGECARARFEMGELIERLIAALDADAGDPDIEDDDPAGGDVLDEPHDERDQGDDEPSLGWPARGPRALGWDDGTDRELDTSDSEPSLGWTGIGNTANGGQFGVLDGEAGSLS